MPHNCRVEFFPVGDCSNISHQMAAKCKFPLRGAFGQFLGVVGQLMVLPDFYQVDTFFHSFSASSNFPYSQNTHLSIFLSIIGIVTFCLFPLPLKSIKK